MGNSLVSESLKAQIHETVNQKLNCANLGRDSRRFTAHFDHQLDATLSELILLVIFNKTDSRLCEEQRERLSVDSQPHLNEFEALLSFFSDSATFVLSLKYEGNKNVNLQLVKHWRHTFTSDLKKSFYGPYAELPNLSVSLSH
jgi:hypothetical protein